MLGIVILTFTCRSWCAENTWTKDHPRTLRTIGGAICGAIQCGSNYDPVIRIERARNIHEAAKYVTKPDGYLSKLPSGSWRCDVDKLETIHYALAGRRMVTWSRSLSDLRKELGFLKDTDSEEEEEDLIHTGDDEDDEKWVVEAELRYCWYRGVDGVFAHYLVERKKPHRLLSDSASPEHWSDPRGAHPRL